MKAHWGQVIIVVMLFVGMLYALLWFVFSAGCGGVQEASQQLPRTEPGNSIISVTGSGNIVVSEEADLAFGANGRIVGIYVAKGDEVSKGQVLARLDAGPLEVALAQAQLAQGQAKAAIDYAEYALGWAEEPFSDEDIEVAGAKVNSAENELYYAEWWLGHAKWSLVRAEKALAQAEEALARATTEDEVEKAEIALAEALEAIGRWTLEVEQSKQLKIPSTQAGLIAAEAKLGAILDAFNDTAVEVAKSQCRTAESQLRAAELALAEAENQLASAYITAPSAGVVADIHAEEGETISATTVIIYLVDLTSIELEVEVDEIDIVDVKVGQKAIIEVDALPALQLEGEVVFISSLPKFDSGIVL